MVEESFDADEPLDVNEVFGMDNTFSGRFLDITWHFIHRYYAYAAGYSFQSLISDLQNRYLCQAVAFVELDLKTMKGDVICQPEDERSNTNDILKDLYVQGRIRNLFDKGQYGGETVSKRYFILAEPGNEQTLSGDEPAKSSNEETPIPYTLADIELLPLPPVCDYSKNDNCRAIFILVDPAEFSSDKGQRDIERTFLSLILVSWWSMVMASRGDNVDSTWLQTATIPELLHAGQEISSDIRRGNAPDWFEKFEKFEWVPRVPIKQQERNDAERTKLQKQVQSLNYWSSWMRAHKDLETNQRTPKNDNLGS